MGQRQIQELFTIGGRIFHQTHWVPLLQMQRSVSEVKFDLMHKTGGTVPIVLNAIRRLHAGVIVHDLAAFVARDRDMYEREILAQGKRLEGAVASSARLEEMARDRALFAEQMLGIVSHDLRNPLAVVEMSTMGLFSSELTAEQQAAVERINRATSRASRLIRELLDFTQARIGSGIAVQLRPIQIVTVIRECLDDLQQLFAGSVLRYAFDQEGECDADADRIVQLIGNLVTNAVAYGSRGHPIEITSALENGACIISVCNVGSPIPVSIQQQLFQPMTRGHQGPGGARSVGLGLYIVREIAKAHLGTVRVESTAEHGTKFTVQFPRQAAL